MDSEKLLDAIGNVDDDLIDEAQKIKKHWGWKQWTAVAAAVLIIAIGLQLISPAFTANNRIQLSMPDRNRVVDSAWASITGGNSSSGMIITAGIAATVRPVEILPDTYYTLESGPSGHFRLVRMETVKVLAGENMVDEFYYVLPDEYVTDLTEYDLLVVKDMTQYSFENCVLYNKTDCAVEAMDLLLFGSFWTNINDDMIAISNNKFDESLWTSTDQWAKDTINFRQLMDAAKNMRYYGRGWSLNQIENAMKEYCIGYPVYFAHDFESEEALEALEYVKPFENGVFIPYLYDSRYRAPLPRDSVYYIRYIDGFPTNDVIDISSHFGAHYYARFDEEDMQKLPDLSAALEQVTEAFEAGEITPPNLKNWETMELTNYSIMGSYEKTGDNVYGLLTVTWRFQASNDPKDHRLDDQYFLMEYGSDTCVPINYSTYKELLNPNFSHSSYEYDENGRKIHSSGYSA